jgi:2-phospho-L-lactate/phosphoenolpyruvate guanylyltransferase
VTHQAPAADLSRLHVLLPVRSLSDGKARLGLALDAEEREALIAGMLRHVLRVLADWQPAQRVWLISPDPGVGALAVPDAATLVPEPAGAELNAALVAGRTAAVADGATAVLCLPADLPLLSSAALDRLLEAADAAIAAGSGRPIVVIAPADARTGTNALLLSPPDAIEPEFGEASLAAHTRASAAAEASLQLVIDPVLGFDLDTPDDLERLDTARLLELEALGAEMTLASEAS